MQNEYDALNYAKVDLAAYSPQPLTGQEKERLTALLLDVPAGAAQPQTARTAQTAPAAYAAASKAARRVVPFKRAAALAAAAALACAMFTAAAAGVFPWDSGLGRLLGITGEEAQRLGVPGQGMDLEQPLGEGSIRLLGVLGDNNCVYLPVEVSLPAGTVEAEDGYSFDRIGFLPQGEHGTSVSLQALPDENPTDGVRQFVLIAATDAPLQGKSATLTLGDLFAYPCPPLEHKENAVLPGTVEFSFRMEYETTALCPTLPREGLALESGLTLRGLELSPLSVSFELEGPEAANGEAAQALAVRVLDAEGDILLLDGEGDILAGQDPKTMQNKSFTSGYTSGEGNKVRLTWVFGGVLDLSQAAVIEVDGRQIPLV